MSPAGTEAGRQEPDPEQPVQLSEEYRRAIEQAESLAQNRPGVDKAWVERTLQEYRAHYARTERTL